MDAIGAVSQQLQQLNRELEELSKDLRDAKQHQLHALEHGNDKIQVHWDAEVQRLVAEKKALLQSRQDLERQLTGMSTGTTPGAGLTAFADALPRVEVFKADGVEWLILPPDIAWLGQDGQDRPVMVRSCYIDLWGAILDRAGNRSFGVCITGTPGIGKSTMMRWLMWMLANKKRAFVVQMHDIATGGLGRLLFDYSTQPALVREGELGAFKAELRDQGALLLCDDHIPTVQFAGAPSTLCFISPRPKAMGTFTKGEGAFSLYMPVWSLTELQAARERLRPGLTADELTGRFATFGGVARFVLASVADAAAAQRAVDSAVLSMKAQDLLDAHGRLALDQDVSHKLMHCKVDSSFQPICVRLGSPTIASRLLTHLQQQDLDGLRTIVRQATGEPHVASLRGALFESLAHKTLSAGGKYAYRVLSEPGALKQEGEEHEEHEQEGGMVEEDEYLEEDRMQVDVASTSQEQGLDLYELPSNLTHTWDRDIKAFISSANPTYLQPIVVNNAAWDAVVITPSTLTILQMTVRNDHPILMHAIQTLLNRIHPLPKKLVFAFVVPDSISSAYTFQQWVVKKGHVAKRVPANLRNMQQVVIALNTAQLLRRTGEVVAS